MIAELAVRQGLLLAALVSEAMAIRRLEIATSPPRSQGVGTAKRPSTRADKASPDTP